MNFTLADISYLINWIIGITAIVIPASFYPIALKWIKLHIKNKVLEPVVYGLVNKFENKTGLTGSVEKQAVLEETKNFIDEWNSKQSNKHFPIDITIAGLDALIDKQVSIMKQNGLEQKGNKDKPIQVPATAPIDVDSNGNKAVSAPASQAPSSEAH